MTPFDVGEGDATIHRALASPSRAALLRYLDHAQVWTTVDDLVVATGLHRNTVREHLAMLEQACLVERVNGVATASRGRPAGRYRSRPRARDEHVRADAMALTAIVAAGFGADRDTALPEAIARAYSWGTGRAQHLDASTPVEAVREVIESAGGATTGDRSCVHVTKCPFAEAAEARPDVVCAIHESMLRGLLAPPHAQATRVTVRSPRGPGSCVVRITEADPRGGTIVPKKPAARPVT